MNHIKNGHKPDNNMNQIKLRTILRNKHKRDNKMNQIKL